HGSYVIAVLPLAPRSLLFPYTTLFRSAPTGPRRRAPPPSPTSPPPRKRPNPSRLRRSREDHGAGSFKWASGSFKWACRYPIFLRSEEHTSELQSRENFVCRLLLEEKKR